MLFSQRQFKELFLNSSQMSSLNEFWQLKTLCFDKGFNVTHLTWESCKMTKVEIISILNFFPNLTSLNCITWKLQTEFYDEPNEMLKLTKLIELKTIRCDEATKTFFESFLCPNTLIKLSTDFDDSEELLSTQQNVADLDLTIEQITKNIPCQLRRLRLMLRRYRQNEVPMLPQIIVTQPNLIHLDILKCEGIFDGDDQAFENICNQSNLKVLKFNADGLSNLIFRENFHKLKRLEELEIESVEHNFSTLVDVIESLSQINLNALEKFRIDVQLLNVPLDRIQRMGKNFPNLKTFTLTSDCPLPVDVYLRNFKLLDEIFVNYHYNRNFSTICDDNDEKFLNLKILHLEGFTFGSDDVNFNEAKLSRLIEKFPNVKVLELDINLPFNIKMLFKILSKMPKVKILNNLLMIQSGENYEKFGYNCVIELIEISKKLDKFSIELKLKAIDMDVSYMKDLLKSEFKFGMRKFGNFVIINLKKKYPTC